MADRNERHFLEFYTPARQRNALRAARRQVNTERRQKHRTTPSSHDKENPTNDHSDFGAVPATIPGEKAVGIGRQRRRLFTRSASKKKCVNDDDGDNGDGNGTTTNAFRSSHDLASVYDKTAEASLPAFASPPESGSTVSRALFSIDTNATTATNTIDDKLPSPNFCSPPGTSNLLNEYRSKQSLLSTSKTRISSFSSPVSGGLRLRPSALWKMGRGDKKIEEERNHNPNVSSSITSIETSKTKRLEVTPTGVDNTTPPSSSSLNDFPAKTSNSGIEREIPSSTNLPPMTPDTTPKRTSFWSPPGTSRLLRKYRQRSQQLHQDPSTFLSPPCQNTASDSNYDRSLTTPRVRRGLRLLDSGAKRCRNRRLSLRPRPISNKATTPENSEIRATIKAGTKAKNSSAMTANNANRSLLSPTTAKRLNMDIQSYRQAHGRAKNNNTLVIAEEESILLEKSKKAGSGEDIKVGYDQEGNESSMDQNDEGLVMAQYPQFLPALSGSAITEGHTVDPKPNGIITDSLPFDELDAANPFIASGILRSNHESSVQTKIAEDTIATFTSSPEVVGANPSDEDAIESGIYRSTRSATRARRQSVRDVVNSVPSLDVTATNSNEGEETDIGDFRSLHDEAEAAIASDSTAAKGDQDEDRGGIYRSTRSATHARRKSVHDAVKAATAAACPITNSQDDEEEGSSVFWSTSSATRTSSNFPTEAVTKTVGDCNDNDDATYNETGIFRSTRSATRARRKSLIDAVKAVSAAETTITKNSEMSVINNILLVDDAACGESNDGLSALTSPLPYPSQDGIDTSSSKGSLQSIWDVLQCGGGESSNHSISSPETRRDNSTHTNIVSRVGDCVNPMASTLMTMWREEEKAAAAGHQKELQASQESNLETDRDPRRESDSCAAITLSAASAKDRVGATVPPPSAGLKVPPSKSFSSNLNLVYGLERVHNLTLTRPKALQATGTATTESPSIVSNGPNPKPSASCSK